MSVAELLRDASLRGRDAGQQTLAAAVESALRERVRSRRMEACYLTPSGEERILDVTLTAVQSPTAEILGSACLINDQTELARIRRQQELRGEMSAEMALELRNSLATISGYAQQLAASRDHELRVVPVVATRAGRLRVVDLRLAPHLTERQHDRDRGVGDPLHLSARQRRHSGARSLPIDQGTGAHIERQGQ